MSTSSTNEQVEQQANTPSRENATLRADNARLQKLADEATDIAAQHATDCGLAREALTALRQRIEQAGGRLMHRIGLVSAPYVVKSELEPGLNAMRQLLEEVRGAVVETPVQEAHRLRVCRICRQPDMPGKDNPLVLNYGEEYAHRKCLDTQPTPTQGAAGKPSFTVTMEPGHELTPELAKAFAEVAECIMQNSEPAPMLPPAPLCQHCGKPEREHGQWCSPLQDGFKTFTPAPAQAIQQEGQDRDPVLFTATFCYFERYNSTEATAALLALYREHDAQTALLRRVLEALGPVKEATKSADEGQVTGRLRVAPGLTIDHLRTLAALCPDIEAALGGGK